MFIYVVKSFVSENSLGTVKQGKGLLLSRGRYGATQKKWHIFYLRPRTEKLVCRDLTGLNYEVFFPVVPSIRVWKNRQKKKVELPLFPNYLFVYTFEHELYDIKRLPRVVTFVSHGGRPSTLSVKEIEAVKRMLGLEAAISVETKFCKGELVRIISGPLAGYEGVLVRQNGKNRFGIQLEAIHHTVFIDIGGSALEKR